MNMIVCSVREWNANYLGEASADLEISAAGGCDVMIKIETSYQHQWWSKSLHAEETKKPTDSQTPSLT